MAGCIGLVSLIAVAGTASAQTSGQREKLRIPSGKSFLDPGTASSARNGPGYVVDGLITTPAWGRNDKFGGGLLPPAIGGGQPLIGGDR